MKPRSIRAFFVRIACLPRFDSLLMLAICAGEVAWIVVAIIEHRPIGMAGERYDLLMRQRLWAGAHRRPVRLERGEIGNLLTQLED